MIFKKIKKNKNQPQSPATITNILLSSFLAGLYKCVFSLYFPESKKRPKEVFYQS